MNDSLAARSDLDKTDSGHCLASIARPDEHPGQIGRFGNVPRMVFHPTADDPTRPNAGTIHYPAGTGFPLHRHDFAQVWYVLEGECEFGEKRLRAGDLVYHADPHEEKDMYTAAGCTMLFVQYPGPVTGARPIFAGRFDERADTQNADLDLAK